MTTNNNNLRALTAQLKSEWSDINKISILAAIKLEKYLEKHPSSFLKQLASEDINILSPMAITILDNRGEL